MDTDRETHEEQQTFMTEHTPAHPTVDTPASVQPGAAAESMDVDMSIAPEPSQIQEFALIPPATEAPANHIVDSPMGNVVQETLVTDAKSSEERIDAALAGHDDKAEGYESSDLESDSDDEPDSSDSDSDSDSEMRVAPKTALTLEQREKALIELDAMDDDEEVAPNTVLHTANEIVQLPEVKKPDIVLSSDSKLESIGTVMSIVDNVVVVQAASSGEVRVLDAGTIAAVVAPKEEDKEEQREILGEIFETFGPVARPLYSIRFNTAAEIPAICRTGCTVYSVPEYSSFVLTEPLKALKGSDASNKYDEEVDEGEMEFSDDEKEMEHKRMLKSAKNKKRGGKDRKVPQMASDTSAALQAMMGETPSSSSSGFTPRQPIALPPRPSFNEPEDGYRILQRPGTVPRTSNAQQSPAGAGTVPWYQQQQRELQNIMGGQQGKQRPAQQQQQQQQQQFQQQQQLQQQLLLQQQQQQQLFLQQQQQQALYQQQIQEAQATIQRLQQQQQQLQQEQQQLQTPPQQHTSTFQFRATQQLPGQEMNASFSPQQAQYQPSAASSFQPQQPAQDNQQQQIMNLLSPLFPQTQNPSGQQDQWRS